MTFDPSNSALLEVFLRERMAQKREWDKLDFKQAWLKEVPGKKKRTVDARAKLELIRDINAMVNTFSLDFDDYGFLVLGVSRKEGKVVQDVPGLCDPGIDALESDIANWLEEYLYPQPEFFLKSFEEPGVGTWGALVLLPNQSPPFIFAKDGDYRQQSGDSHQLWREGEWRLRRNAITVKPGGRDYSEMLRAKIQGATEPLQRELNDLRRTVAVLEGKVEALGHSRHADIEVTLMRNSSPVSEVEFTAAQMAGRQALQPYLKKFEELRHVVETVDPNASSLKPLERSITHQGEWYDRVSTFDAYIKIPPAGYPNPLKLDEVLPFLKAWGLDISEESRSFPGTGLYRRQRYTHDQSHIWGPHAKRATAYLEMLRLAQQILPEVKKAVAHAPFLEFQLRVKNTSGVTTGETRLELRCIHGAELHRYAPGPNGSAAHFGVHYSTRDYAQPLTVMQETRATLLPGDTWFTQPFALKFNPSYQDVTLGLTVWAAGIPGPKEIQIELRAIPKLSSADFHAAQ